MTVNTPRRPALSSAIRHAVNSAAWRIGQKHARIAAAELTERLRVLAAAGADDAALLAAIDSPLPLTGHQAP